MANPDNSLKLARPRSRAWRILFVGGGGLLLVLVIFFGAGRWLVVEDPLVKARTILVLSGAMPLSAIEAAKLYREGYAPEIWLTHSAEPGETLERMGIPFSGEDAYNKLVLIHEGVPPEVIHVLEPSIVNTADEIKVAAAALARVDGTDVIICHDKSPHPPHSPALAQAPNRPRPSNRARRRRRSLRSPALVAQHERRSRSGPGNSRSVERLGGPALASGSLILDCGSRPPLSRQRHLRSGAAAF